MCCKPEPVHGILGGQGCFQGILQTCKPSLIYLNKNQALFVDISIFKTA